MRTKNIGDIKPGDFYYLNRHSFVLALDKGHKMTDLTKEYIKYVCIFHNDFHLKVFQERGGDSVTLTVL